MFSIRLICVSLLLFALLGSLKAGRRSDRRRGDRRRRSSSGGRRDGGGHGNGDRDGDEHRNKDKKHGDRCKPHKCPATWSGCSVTCGGGTQTPSFNRNRDRCRKCNLPSPRPCHTQCCPVNCAWGGWGSWGSCSVRCGGGTRSRSRGYSQSARCGGSGCSGSTTSSERCNTQCCPVNCAWGAWGNYGSCSALCGGGSQSRSRSLTRATSCGGTCSGSKTSSRNCNSHPCPINCQWGPWGNFGVCSRSCGSGTQSRTRSVLVRPQHGGAACSGSSSSSRTCNSHPCPINCQWGPWGNFGACSRSCGSGTQSRTRSVLVRPLHGGAACSGSSSSSRTCNSHPCPINCQWGHWGNFGACSRSCGSGTQSRTRSVLVRPQHGGAACSGSSSSSRTCNSHPCPINCQWGHWGKFGACSRSCGSGTQSRTRGISVWAQHGGAACSGSSSSSQTCNSHPCPINCQWGAWSVFDNCNVSCGGGTQSRYRRVAIGSQYGGNACSGSSSSSQQCNTHPCPVDCLWGEWGSFGVCSVNCGGGTQSRIREITQVALHGGQNCTGHAESTQTCNTQCCPVDCEWGPWSEYGACNESCGGGVQTRNRQVHVPAKCEGAPCFGAEIEFHECNTQCCAVDCEWSPWSEFGACNESCGGGVQTRSRQVHVPAKCEGAPCFGAEIEFHECNTQCCAIDCEWGPWSEYGACNESCGGGVQSRNRQVHVPAKCEGAPCFGAEIEFHECNTQCCPVDCEWGPWSEYGACNESCGGGVQTRNRQVHVPAKCEGAPCFGAEIEFHECNTQCCAVDCEWSPWSEFGACNESCGGGVQTRSRQVHVPAKCEGAPCFGAEIEFHECNTQCCAIDCEWGPWSEYGACNESCGGGVQSRNRQVHVPAKCEGAPCFGAEIEFHECNTQCCPVDCEWGPWSEYGACNESCGGGVQTRNRQVHVPAKCEGAPCFGAEIEFHECNTQCCAVDCEWGPWSEFGACNESCGGGVQSRNRQVHVPAKCEGAPCFGAEIEFHECNTQCCPVDCEWGPWSEYGACNESCGGGVQTRNRQVHVPAKCEGAPCFGAEIEFHECNTQCCAVDCEWGLWSEFGACNESCGGGVQTRNRQVHVPAKCEGAPCFGAEIEFHECNTQCCAVDCEWGPWSEYGACNESCGGGVQTRNRQVHVPAKCEGSLCLGSGFELRECNTQCCPVDCTWGQWADWSTCSHTCGKGSQMRGRTFDQFETCGGLSCDGNFTEERSCNDVCCPVDCAWGRWSEWGGCSTTCGPGQVHRSRVVDIEASCQGSVCNGSSDEVLACYVTDCIPEICINRECPPNFRCVAADNSEGYTCVCKRGFHELQGGEECSDTDECEEETDNCDENADCVNTPGSFHCQCEDGYEGDGHTCAEISPQS